MSCEKISGEFTNLKNIERNLPYWPFLGRALPRSGPLEFAYQLALLKQCKKGKGCSAKQNFFWRYTYMTSLWSSFLRGFEQVSWVQGRDVASKYKTCVKFCPLIVEFRELSKLTTWENITSKLINGQRSTSPPQNQFDHFCLLNHAQCSPNFRTSKETCCSAKMYTVHFPHHIEIMRSRGGKMTRGIANLWGFLAGQKGFKMYHFFINTQVEHGKLASKIRAPVFWENCRLSLVISYERRLLFIIIWKAAFVWVTPYLVQLTFSLEACSWKNGDLVFQRWSFFSILETCMGIDDPYVKKPLYYKVLPQHYSVLQSITPVLLCTTKYYSSTTKYYSSTTLYYKVLPQYYSVLQSTTPALQSTTPVLLCTTKYYSSTTLYYKVLLQDYIVLQSTTPALLCTTKYYPSTTLYCKELLQYYSVLQSTTPVLLLVGEETETPSQKW